MSVRITVCVLTVTALTLRDHFAASVTLVTSLHKREATAKILMSVSELPIVSEDAVSIRWALTAASARKVTCSSVGAGARI